MVLPTHLPQRFVVCWMTLPLKEIQQELQKRQSYGPTKVNDMVKCSGNIWDGHDMDSLWLFLVWIPVFLNMRNRTEIKTKIKKRNFLSSSTRDLRTTGYVTEGRFSETNAEFWSQKKRKEKTKKLLIAERSSRTLRDEYSDGRLYGIAHSKISSAGLVGKTWERSKWQD